MLAYLFLLAIPSVLALTFVDKRNIGLSLFFVALIYVVFIGFRFQTGSDWPAYTKMYHTMAEMTLYDSLFYTEPGYAALNWLMAQIGIDLVGVNVVVAIIFIYGLMRFAQLTPQPWLALVAVTPYLIIVIGMSATRQAAAIGIVFIVLASWKQGVLKKVLLSLIAISFHYSAVLVLFFVLYSMKMPSWLKWMVLIVGGIVSFSVLKSTPKFEQYHQTYAVANIVSYGAVQHALLNAIPGAIYLFFIKKWDIKYESIDLMRILSIASIISVFAVSLSSTAVDRLSLYLSPIQMMVYATIPIVFRNQSYAIAIIAIHFMILVVWLSYSNTAYVFMPYRNSFFN